MKTLLEFERKQKVNGEEVVRKFAILKPSQALKEESDEFSAVEQSSLLKKGVLTRQMMRKRLLEGEIYTETEKQEIYNLYEDFNTLNIELRTLLAENVKPEDESKTKRIAELQVKTDELRESIQKLEVSQMSLYDNTVEVIARNRVVFWWTLVLILENKDGKFVSLCKSRNYNDLRDRYDELTEDPFYADLLRDVSDIVVLWYLNVIKTKEDFESHWKRSQEPQVSEEKALIEPVKAEEEKQKNNEP